MLVVRIKHLRGTSEWCHYFYDASLCNLTLVGLSQFFARKAKIHEEHMDLTWDYTAYKFAEEKVLLFKETGIKATYEWSLEIQDVALEKLP